MDHNDPFVTVGSDDCLDLRVGNPEFLFSYWDDFLNTEPIPSLDYPLQEPDKELLKAIRSLHKHVDNVADIEKKYVVVTSGATHGLHVAIATLANRHRRKNKGDKLSVYARPPYWPRFRQIANNTGNAQFVIFNHLSNVTIHTVPNNPDMAWKIGNYDLTSSDPDQIYDLSYNWHTYSPAIYTCDDKVAVFSMSKLSGNAGLRLGWIITKDPSLAYEMSNLIEIQCSGISREAQSVGTAMIKQIVQSLDTDRDFFEYGRKELTHRWNIVQVYLAALLEPDAVKNDKGMFLFGQSEKMIEILERNNILYISGESMGLEEPSYFRLNLGCSDKKFSRFIDILEREMEDELR